MKPFGFTIGANHGKTTSKPRNTATATTRKSPGQICVSPAEKTAKQHKTGPEPHQTKNTTFFFPSNALWLSPGR